MNNPFKLLHVADQPADRPESSGRADEGHGGPLSWLEVSACAASRSRLSRYGVAVAIAAATVLLLGLFEPLFGGTAPPLVLVALAVAAAACWGGLGPGLVTTAICILVAWWAFIPPHFSFAIRDPAEAVRLVFAALCCVAISFLAEAMHRAAARQRLAIARLTTELETRRKMEATLREQAQVLDFSAAIVESSEDAIISKDLNGIIRSWNAAERMFGYSAEEAIGQPISLLAPPDRVEEEAETLQRLRRSWPWATWRPCTWRRTDGGSTSR